MLAGGTTDSPTGFAELNELLAEVVGRVRSVLGESLAGVYLTGSFALGAGDLYSDCDFLVVTDDRLTEAMERQLRALHDEIPTRDEHWAINLEGSYAPREDLEALADDVVGLFAFEVANEANAAGFVFKPRIIQSLFGRWTQQRRDTGGSRGGCADVALHLSVLFVVSVLNPDIFCKSGERAQ